jgi:hypothetical protein
MMRSLIAATGCALQFAAFAAFSASTACMGGGGGGPSTEEPASPAGGGAEALESPLTAAVGATLPYVEQEAENAATNGTILSSRVWRTLAY